MFNLNKLSEKELSYLIRESIKALRGKISITENITVTGYYGRWLFAHKNNFEQYTNIGRTYDATGNGYNYIVSANVSERTFGNFRITREVPTNNFFHVFILFGEDYEVVKALKIFFHCHAENLFPITLDFTISIDQEGVVKIPGMYNDLIQNNNNYFHIDYIDIITDHLN